MGATSCPMERAGSARRSSRNRSTGRRSSPGLGKWQGKARARHRNGARCAHATLDGASAHSSVCGTPRRNAGARPMATELKATPPQQDTPTSRFKQCLRERLRLARELARSEEHTSELQSHSDLVCRLLLEKKKQKLQRVCWLCCV